MEIVNRFAGVLLLLVLPVMAGATPLWSDVTTSISRDTSNNGAADARYKAYRHLSVDINALQSILDTAPMERTAAARAGAARLQLPMPNGLLQAFTIEESPIMDAASASGIQFKSYRIKSVVNPAVSGRASISPRGFNAILLTPEGSVFINPAPGSVNDQYYSFYKHDYIDYTNNKFACGVHGAAEAVDSPVDAFRTLHRTTGELIEYDLAIAATVEYDAATGGGAATTAEIANAINAVNAVYERDLGIHLNLVANDGTLVSSASSDFTNGNAGAMINEVKPFIDSNSPALNYDIGHVFGTGANSGLAGYGVVCDSLNKARGVSLNTNPVGNPYYIDFVAHEIGHQFRADHTFNGTTGSCGGGNRNGSTAYEPGSGSTVMAYAGICGVTGAENVQINSDAIFHAGSIEQIVNYSRNSAGNTCSSPSGMGIGNNRPTANAGPDYIIPRYSPFELDGSATPADPDADALTYQWDQMDTGTSTDTTTYGQDLCSNALFRSFPDVASAVRDFPDIDTIRSGGNDPAQVIPTQARYLNFRLTVRDGNGGVDEDDMQITVVDNSDVFAVLQPNSGALILQENTSHVIEWNSACTEQAPVNCANVDILLSKDSGQTYPTVLANSTPNDGSQSVVLPAPSTNNARIKIICSDNIFFDISDADFTLAPAGAVLGATGNGGSIGCTPGSLPTSCSISSGLDQEPNDTPGQASPVTLPANITGNVNDSSDTFDYYVFTAPVSAGYIFVLSNYGNNDLDLLLFDSSGTNLIIESVSEADPTETFTAALTAGQTYYAAVNAWNTSGLTSSYLLSINAPGGGGGDSGALDLWMLLVIVIALYFRLEHGRKIENN